MPMRNSIRLANTIVSKEMQNNNNNNNNNNEQINYFRR